jgi:cell pole-organizing protein PopZ
MQSTGREPSMEDILASIKKVIAEEKELRGSADAAAARQAEAPASDEIAEEDEDVLELDQPLVAQIDLGPPLLDAGVAKTARHSLDELSTVAASVPPPPQVNPLEEMIRDMLRPLLKQWLDEHLPEMVGEHVKREISRITGRPV